MAIYWLIFSGICFAGEALGVTGVGLFFAALGSASVALMMQTGMPAEGDLIAQCAAFFGFTALWAAVLWRPIKQYRMRQKSSDYHNMVGDRAKVIEQPLVKGRAGNVSWSGTTMLAEIISSSTAAQFAVGDMVVIKEVKGNTLFVDAA